MNSHFEIVAHRGAATIAPENTIQAFQKAIDLGADAIKLDVWQTNDNAIKGCMFELKKTLHNACVIAR